MLIIELHHKITPNDDYYYVNASFNRQEVAIPGICMGAMHCDLQKFIQLIDSYSLDQVSYAKACGPSPAEQLKMDYDQWASTMFQGKIIKTKKNQLMRIAELYAVMMLIIIIGWIIYAIFRIKETSHDYHDHHSGDIPLTH